MVKNFGDDEQRAHDPSAHEQRMDSEKHVQRNPHPDFAKVQASRPDWNVDREWNITKTKEPNWKLGQGGNDGGESLKKNHVEINPYEEGRPAVSNYKLLISGIVPRPIGFLSTYSKHGTECIKTPFLLIQGILMHIGQVNLPTSPLSAIRKLSTTTRLSSPLASLAGLKMQKIPYVT